MKAFVINLDRSTSRWDHFKEVNSTVLNDIHRISAVDGRLLKDKWQYVSRWMHLTHEPSKFNIMPAIGCFLSHRKCWQQVVEQNLPYALVLEDDVMATEFTSRFLKAYVENPLPFDWVKLHVNRHANRPDKQQSIGASLVGIELCVCMHGSKSTGAYIITNAGAHKALRAEKMLVPVDHVEWLHGLYSLIFIQTRQNVFEVPCDQDSSITLAAPSRARRWLAIARIGLLRATICRVWLSSNLTAAKRLAAGGSK